MLVLFWGTLGWTSTTLRWIGPAVRLCLGASLVMLAVLVLPLLLCLFLLCCRSKQLISPGFRRSTWICGWFSAGPEPPRFLPTVRSIVPSISSQALLHLGVASFPCLVLNVRPWTSTFKNPSRPGSFATRLPLLALGSSLLRRRMALCVHVLITVG